MVDFFSLKFSVNVQKDANFKQDIKHHNNQNTESQDQRSIGKAFIDNLCFKCADMPTGKHIYIKYHR